MIFAQYSTFLTPIFEMLRARALTLLWLRNFHTMIVYCA